MMPEHSRFLLHQEENPRNYLRNEAKYAILTSYVKTDYIDKDDIPL